MRITIRLWLILNLIFIIAGLYSMVIVFEIARIQTGYAQLGLIIGGVFIGMYTLEITFKMNERTVEINTKEDLSHD